MQYEMGMTPKIRTDIDLLCLQPGYVKTKMIKAAEDKGTAFAVVSVEDCVSAALRDLGHEICTYGPISHEVLAGVGAPF